MAGTRIQPKYVDGKTVHRELEGYQLTEEGANSIRDMFSRARKINTECDNYLTFLTADCLGKISAEEAKTGLAKLIKMYVSMKGSVRFDPKAQSKVISDESIRYIADLVDRVKSYNHGDHLFSMLAIENAYVALHEEYARYLCRRNEVELLTMVNTLSMFHD